MKKKITFTILILFTISTTALLSTGQNSKRLVSGNGFSKINLKQGDQQKDYATNPNSTLNENDKCKKIKLASNKPDLFVPYRTQEEWESFLTHVKSGGIEGVEVNKCCINFGQNFGGQFC